jgi:hypothetical protein
LRNRLASPSAPTTPASILAARGWRADGALRRSSDRTALASQLGFFTGGLTLMFALAWWFERS